MTTRPARRTGALWRAFFRWSVRILLLVLMLLLAALLWLGSEGGLTQALSWTQQLLARQGQALAFEQLRGNLWRGIRLGRVEWRGAGTVVKGNDLQVHFSLRALLRGKGLVHLLKADTLIIQVPPGEPDKPRTDAAMPGNIGLPLPLEIQTLAVKRLEIQPPAVDGRDAPAHVVLSDIDGAAQYSLGQYRISALTIVTPWGKAHTDTLQMDAAPPHHLKGEVLADGHAQQWPYHARLQVDGDLARLPATLSGQLADGMADVRAVVRPLGRMPLENLHVRLADTNLARFTALGTLPETGVDLDVDMDPVVGKHDLWQGKLRLANRLSGTLEAGRVPLTALQSHITLRIPSTEQWSQLYLGLKDLAIDLPVSGGKAAINRAESRLAGGTRAASAADSLTPNAPLARGAHITGQLESWLAQDMALPGITIPRLKTDLKLTDLDLAPLWKGLPQTVLGGQVSVDGQQFLVDMAQRAEQMRTLLPPELKAAAADAQVRLDGTLDARWLKLTQARVSLGDSLLTAAGQAAVSAPWDLKLQGTARRLDLAQWLPASLPIDPAWRTGMLGADWHIDGRLMAPGQKAALGLDLVDSRVAGQPLTGSLHGRAELDAGWQPQLVRDLDLTLAHGAANRIHAQGALGRPDDRMDIRATLTDLKALDSRLSGNLALAGHLDGRFPDLTAKLQLQAAAAGWTTRDAHGKPSHMGLKDLKADLSAPLSLQNPARLEAPVDLALSAHQVDMGTGVLDGATLNLHGSSAQHQLDAALRMGKDRLLLQLLGGISLSHGAPTYRAQVQTLDLSGRTSVRLTDPAPLALDASHLTLDRFRLSALGGHMDLAHLALNWGGALTYDSRGTVEGLIPLQLHQALGVTLDKNADALRNVRLDAHWQMQGQGQEALSGDLAVKIREQVGAGQKKQLGLSDDNGLTVRVDKNRLDGRIKLNLPSLGLVSPLAGPDMAVDGSLLVDGAIAGTLNAPLLDVHLSGKDLSVLQRSAGLRLAGGVLDAQLNGKGLLLRQLRFSAGKSSLMLNGRAQLVEREGGNVKAAIAAQERAWTAIQVNPPKGGGALPSLLPMDGVFDVRADHFMVPIGPGQRVTLSGATRLTSSVAGLLLAGDMKVDEGLIELQGSAAPELPSDVKVTGESSSQDQPEVAPEDTLRIASDLGVSLGNSLRINGMGAEARLGGKLEVQGFLPAEPRLLGLVKIVDGSYQAYGQNLKFTKGLIRFSGPVDNPSLDLEAKRPFLPVEVGIAITGQASNPQISLISRPSMSDTNKLSWLVLGVPPDEAGGAAQALALQQAGSLLLGNNSGVRTPSIADRLGLDVLNYGYASNTEVDSGIQDTMTPKGLVGQSSSSNSDATETGVVSLGKRINDRLFVSYEKGIRGVWALLRIQYTLGKGYVLRAQTGSDNSLDLLRSRSFN